MPPPSCHGREARPARLPGHRPPFRSRPVSAFGGVRADGGRKRLETARCRSGTHGYGLHPIADTRYEIPVAFEATEASASEPVVLSEMVRELLGKDRGLADRCSDFSADRGLDSATLKAALWDDHGIRPLLEGRPGQMRSLVGAVPFADTGQSPSTPFPRLYRVGRALPGDGSCPFASFKLQSFSFGPGPGAFSAE